MPVFVASYKKNLHTPLLKVFFKILQFIFLDPVENTA